MLITLDGGAIRFRMEFYPLGLDPALVRVDYGLGMDQDPSTGSVGTGWEYWTTNLTPAADTATLWRRVDAATSEALATVALERGADWAQFGFDLALLGGDAQFDFSAGTFVKVSDAVFTGHIDNVTGSTVVPQQVPEPGSLALGLAATFAWLGGCGARRRKAASTS